MTYKIECDSPLLQYTLEYFLKEYLDENGVIISDNPQKDGIIIGREIKKPFSRATLIMQLQKISDTNSNEPENFEKKFDEIFEKFKNDLLELIKDYYGKE